MSEVKVINFLIETNSLVINTNRSMSENSVKKVVEERTDGSIVIHTYSVVNKKYLKLLVAPLIGSILKVYTTIDNESDILVFKEKVERLEVAVKNRVSHLELTKYLQTNGPIIPVV